MVSKIFFRTLYALAVLVVIINAVFTLHNSLNPDINDLPEGRLETSSVSPDGRARIDIYVVDCNLGTGVKGVYIEGNRRKNIYWQTDQTEAAVRWTDNSKVIIDNIVLDVHTEVFDSRFGTAIFSEGILRRSRRNL